MQAKDHWENVYRSRAAEELSWYQARATLSLKIIQQNSVSPDAAIIDIGAGASMFVDDLLANGFSKITILDLSRSALDRTKARLAEKAELVNWLECNVLEAEFQSNAYAVWHDRAVFHFLTSAVDRTRYIEQLHQALSPGGLFILATFAEDGPLECSGLPVVRYSPAAILAELGPLFNLLACERENHITPAGNEQKFRYFVFRRGPE